MGLRAKAVYMLRQFPFITPRSIVSSCAEWIDNLGKQKGTYFNQRGPWYKTIFPESFLQQPAPQTVGEPNEKAFYINRNYPTPKASLFYLQNSYVFGHKGLILSANHEVFQEFSHHFSMATLKKFFRQNLFYTFSKKAKQMNGVGAVLVSPESHNYYHWLSDILPRIKLYEDVLDQIDHFCIASNVPGKFLEVLKDFGIPDEKVLLIQEKEKIHFDNLYVASLPGSEGRSPQWAVDYVREKLVKPVNTTPSKKIYFTRGENAERNILNETELVTALQGKGFEIIDPGKLSIREQGEMMQQAKIVVSAHGAALCNLLFSRDNTAVIELFSPDYFRTDCYYTLSALRRLNYWYIVGDKPNGAAWGDIILPLKLLTETLQQVEGK
jgi:capsular polysaccharide biosynthesis protein